MCKVGGPRCDGSHKPSTAQRARRKANTAYRNAVADAVLKTTDDDDLARRVKHASMTDLHDIVTAGGYDAEAIAKKCGTATYTSPDGETATVDVVPTGNTRRTPISDETKELLEDIDDAMGSLPGGFYREAVLEGDREGAEKMVASADETIAGALDRAATMDFDNATDDEVAEALNHLSHLDDLSMAMRGHGFEFSEDDGSYQAWERVRDEHARRVGGGSNFLEDIGRTPDDINENSAGDIADLMDERLREYDVHSMSESEFQKTYDRAKAASVLLDEYGHGDNAAIRMLDAEKDRRALSAEERAKTANYGYGDVDEDNADMIASAASSEIVHADLSGMTDAELDDFHSRFERLDDQLANVGNSGIFDDLAIVTEEIDRRKSASGADSAYPKYGEYISEESLADAVAEGTIEVTPDNADEVSEAVTDQVGSSNIDGMSDSEFEEFYDNMLDIDGQLRDAGHDGVYEMEFLHDEYNFRKMSDSDRYDAGTSLQRHSQLTHWAEETVDEQGADVDRGMYMAARYLHNPEYHALSGDEAGRWADEVLKNQDEYDKFEIGVAQNVADRQEWNSIKDTVTDVSALSDDEVESYSDRMIALTTRMNDADSVLLEEDRQAEREIRALDDALIREHLARDEKRAEAERAAKSANAAGSGSSQTGSTETQPEDQAATPEGVTWSVGTVVWAPTKGDTFARVVSLTDKTVTLEQMETNWDAPSRGRQTYSPGAPTGRTYRRQIQRNAAGDMTCKAGPTRSSAMMVKWG